MKYETFLRRENLTDSTIQNYVWTANYFNIHYPEVNKTNLLSYKEYLMEHYAPSTVNVRILGINKYLQYLGKEKLRLKTVRIQRKTFLDTMSWRSGSMPYISPTCRTVMADLTV